MLRNLNTLPRALGITRVGVSASAVPAAGTHGPGYLHPWLQANPAYSGALVRGRITSRPLTGQLDAFEDSSFVFNPAGDGEFSFEFQPYANGVAAGGVQAVALVSGSAGGGGAVVVVSADSVNGGRVLRITA